MSNRNIAGAALSLLVLAGCGTPEGEIKPVVLPDPESAGAKVLKEHCSSCHGAPSPVVHTAEEWPNIVYRMQEHRRMNGYTLIVPEQEQQLLDYLKQYAKG